MLQLITKKNIYTDKLDSDDFWFAIPDSNIDFTKFPELRLKMHGNGLKLLLEKKVSVNHVKVERYYTAQNF